MTYFVILQRRYFHLHSRKNAVALLSKKETLFFFIFYVSFMNIHHILLLSFDISAQSNMKIVSCDK